MVLRPHTLCWMLLGAIVLCLVFIGYGPEAAVGFVALIGAIAALVMGWLTVRNLTRPDKQGTPP